ncbi:DUF2285 domain-containing protein [Bradyrhizobium sp. 169]|uniref:DUF2285 domain-containing protein n=2 Tax=unclassified Bradyrhizobium TaxID=2631580 RepID=UPI0031F6875A
MSIRRIGSIRVFGAAFTHDPQGSFYEQTIFWAPEAMPTVVPIVRSASGSQGSDVVLPLADLTSATMRQAPDGWHALLLVQGAQHRLWLREAPHLGTGYATELPLDENFVARAHAAHRLWRALNGRPPGSAFHRLSAQQRKRLGLALRARDGHEDGASYRTIAEVMFGKRRLIDRGWKTHDLRSRTIRLVKAGRFIVRTGYRALFRSRSRKK